MVEEHAPAPAGPADAREEEVPVVLNDRLQDLLEEGILFEDP
jgi:hypothetical protein